MCHPILSIFPFVDTIPFPWSVPPYFDSIYRIYTFVSFIQRSIPSINSSFPKPLSVNINKSIYIHPFIFPFNPFIHFIFMSHDIVSKNAIDLFSYVTMFSHFRPRVIFPRVSFLCLTVAHEKTHEYGCASNKESYSLGNNTWSEMGTHCHATKKVYTLFRLAQR